MSKYSSKKKPVSEQTKEEALKIARSTQKPGQTKEQTKLIAQGIQKGINQYKKQYKKKSRELDKKRNKTTTNQVDPDALLNNDNAPDIVTSNKLPWILLIFTWAGFATYFLTN